MQWLYAFIPVLVTFLGATWVTYRQPAPPVVGAIQHFAAGVVFYAAAGELLPDVMHNGGVWVVVLGGAAGSLRCCFCGISPRVLNKAQQV
jgi:ZIP family zinc transporter